MVSRSAMSWLICCSRSASRVSRRVRTCSQGASPASLVRAGAYLATGVREQAQALLPTISGMQLQHASSEALATLLRVLALLTAACAALLHLLLRKRKDAVVGRTA